MNFQLDLSRIKTCVLSLLHAEVASVLPERLAASLLDEEHYDLRRPDRVYRANSRDGWTPFVRGEDVLSYLRDAEFRPTPLSGNLSQIDNFQVRHKLLNQVHFYLVDPLYLSLADVPQDFVQQLDTVLSQGRKPYGVILPERISHGVRDDLENISRQKLQLAYQTYRGGRWFIRNEREFADYLQSDDLATRIADILTFEQTGISSRRTGPPRLFAA